MYIQMIQDEFLSCMYFVLTGMTRKVDELASESFRETGLAPSYAFLMMLVIDSPGLTITEIAAGLHLAHSTTSRFIDKLESKGYLIKETDGKTKHISPTPEGMKLRKQLHDCWGKLYQKFVSLFGQEDYKDFTIRLMNQYEKL